MKYTVIVDEGEVINCNTVDEALEAAAEAHLNGKVARILQPMGDIEYVARFATPQKVRKPKKAPKRKPVKKVAKTSKKSKTKRVAAKVASSTRVKRSPEDLAKLKDRVLAIVAKNPGARAETISKALEVPNKDIVLPIRKLIDEKKLSSKGQKRATEYYSKN